MRRPQQSKPAGVGVIAKVFQILEAIQGSPSGLTLKPICDITGVHKSTAHRFLKHLERDGYVLRTEPGAYMIGPRLSRMGARSNHRVTLQAVARPILWELWKSTGETVNLAVIDQGTVLYVDVMESAHEFRLASRVGIRRPLHATGLGKALAAFMPEEQRERALSTVSFQPLTSKTITNMVQFRSELERVRAQGYSLDDEETTQGARCVSAPIFDADRFAVAAVSVSAPVTRVSREQVPSLAAAVMAAARAVSIAMGFPQHEPQSTESIPPRDKFSTV
jgi:IclR family acetate operon transcriptional repressor